MEKDKWDYYPVQINEPVSFSEAKKILSQTLNTDSYYFKPGALNIRKGTNPEPGEKEPLKETANSPDAEENDISLNLKGHFVVRQR